MLLRSLILSGGAGRTAEGLSFAEQGTARVINTGRVPRDGAVLAPADLAPWVATTLHPAWGSHDFLSISYAAQNQEAARFYADETTEEQRMALIADQRFRYVVTSRPGLLPSRDPIASAGRYQLYAFPGNTLGGYPGSVALGLTPSSTLRQGILRRLRSLVHSRVKPPGL